MNPVFFLGQKNKVCQYVNYLQTGHYQFDDECRVLFKSNQNKHPMLQAVSQHNDFYLEIVDKDHKDFAGQILWFCMNGDVRIFSDQSILVLCENQHNYLSKLENYRYFSEFFNVPKILETYPEKRAYLEQLIHFDAEAASGTWVLKNIFADYQRYFEAIPKEQLKTMAVSDLFAMPNGQYRTEFENIIQKIDPILLHTPFPVLKLHGDLWSANLLRETLADGESRLCYIDWDESADYIFFYDFFKFFWNELDVHHQSIYLKDYLAGHFDSTFSAMFQLFDLNFETRHRIDYFYLYFLSFLLDEHSMSYDIKHMELISFQEKIIQGLDDKT